MRELENPVIREIPSQSTEWMQLYYAVKQFSELPTSANLCDPKPPRKSRFDHLRPPLSLGDSVDSKEKTMEEVSANDV